MTFTQRRMIRDAHGREREVVWDIDMSVLAETQRWAGDSARVERELGAMAEMYPSWVLTNAVGAQLAEREQRADIAVPTGDAWRWASDGSLIANMNPENALMWEGLLPAPLGGLNRTRKKLSGQYPVEEIRGQAWTAVPVRVLYSSNFPRAVPDVSYSETWLRALQIASSANQHLYGGGRLCLFYPGQWKVRYTVADVLSQRVINHVYSMLKIANGMSPANAFIGRIHAEQWLPER